MSMRLVTIIHIFTAGVALLLILNVVVRQQSRPAYRVDYPDSYLIAVTHKEGMLAVFAGHDHAVIAPKWSASVNIKPDDISHASATITVPTDNLVIDSREARQLAGLGGGPSTPDVRTIQQRMLSGEVLDAAKFPQIKFTSTAIQTKGNNKLLTSGEMEIHGRQHRVTFPVHFHSEGERTEFDGEFTIRQTEYGLQPESVAGGSIKVENAVTIRFHLVMKDVR
jgi:polyisoprenoid-binding protein YceI